MRSTLRPALLLLAAAVVAAAPVAAAAPGGPRTLTVADPVGDDVAPTGASDLVGLTMTTTGTGDGDAYVPKRLVVTLTLASQPSADGTVLYGFEMQVPGCGEVFLQYAPGSATVQRFNWAPCGSEDLMGEGTSFDVGQKVKGDSIVWTLPFTGLPFELERGTVLSEALGYTDLVDPVTGYAGGANTIGVPMYDVVGADEAYTVG